MVEAFWLSKKRYSIEELFNQVSLDDKLLEEDPDILAPDGETFADGYERILLTPNEKMTEEKKVMIKGEKRYTEKQLEAKEMYGDQWFQDRVVDRKPKKEKGEWTCHRGLYDWFLREAKNDPFVGGRYHRIHALAEYARKCNISYDEFKKDAYELYLLFKDVDESEPFLYEEFVKARNEYFNKISIKSTREWVEEKTKVPMQPPAKRNGRKRKEHLQADRVKNEQGRMVRNVCKLHREDILEDMRANGEIPGRPSKQQQVQEWRKNNPRGKKIDCQKETGLSRPTVLKWWDL
mgnify:CR=1 FL=1